MSIQIILIIIFFFSSRRRHTRSLCDWSSDVCSSDLSLVCPSPRTSSSSSCTKSCWRSLAKGRPGWPSPLRPRARSEERRVGKECRCRGCADEFKRYSDKHSVRTNILYMTRDQYEYTS